MPIEGEALAVVDALDKARHLVLGCSDLIIAVNHKPLLKVFLDRSLEDISNTCLRNLKEKTLRYKFKMVHIPGVKHSATDCLSCYPTGEPVKLILTDDLEPIASNHDAFQHLTQSLLDLRVYDTTDSDIEECVIAATTTSLNALNLKSVSWDRVRTATASDEDMLVLTELIESGMPEFHHEMPNSIRKYFQFRDDLSTIDGVIVYKDRIVIPPSLRDEVLCALHSAHQGVTSMIARAEASVFWPGIMPVIAALRASCLQSQCTI